MENGECAKEFGRARVADSETVVRLLRPGFIKREPNANQIIIGKDFLLKDEVFFGCDNGWSFIRHNMIAADGGRLRQIADITTREPSNASQCAHYACIKAGEIRSIAVAVMNGIAPAMAVIHDGEKKVKNGVSYREHVSVENCVPMTMRQIRRIRSKILQIMQTRIEPLVS